MKVSRLVLAKVLADRLDAGMDEKQLSRETAAYLMEERRTGELDSLLRDIQQYRLDHDGVLEVEVVSAYLIDSRIKADIEAKLRQNFPRAKRIVLSQRIDPELIGGFRLILANQQLDLSIRSKLNRFKQLTAVGN